MAKFLPAVTLSLFLLTCVLAVQNASYRVSPVQAVAKLPAPPCVPGLWGCKPKIKNPPCVPGMVGCEVRNSPRR